VELHNFKLEPLQGGFTGTLDGLHLKVAVRCAFLSFLFSPPLPLTAPLYFLQEINTLLGDIPLTLESGIVAKASVEISVKRVQQHQQTFISFFLHNERTGGSLQCSRQSGMSVAP
jgi:hypothetical protein